MGCGAYFDQLHEIERAISSLQPHVDLPGIGDALKTLQASRAELLAKIGIKFPRTITQILKLIGLSPGSLVVYHDVEGGWLVAARKHEGAPPAYHYVDDATAVKLLSGGLDHELEDWLMTPDNYAGE